MLSNGVKVCRMILSFHAFSTLYFNRHHMKLRNITFGAVIVTITLIFGFQTKPIPVSDFELLQKNFKNPSKNYGSVPFWVWHTKMTKGIIDSIMLDFKTNAFGGVMVHPRPGLITEYLSKEWYDLFQYTVKKGKELGLNVWIYDENSYPTGFAGGLVPEQMPESYNQGQMLRMTKTSVFPTADHEVFIALKEMNGKLIDITAEKDKEEGKSGSYYLFNKVYYRKQAGMVGPPDFPYVDLMVKGVTQKFIDVTFKGYEQVAGKEFGKTVPGIFSDEPSIPAQGAGNVRWTPDLFTEFKAAWNYDLIQHLPSLFEETGDWRKVRHNYLTVLSQLFIDRWSKPMYAYTEKNKLKWTGHYWEHGWPNPNDVPDNMAMYAYHQYPGIDMLFNQYDEKSPNAQFGNIRAVKELASVANQLGKERTLSETYGGAGWELTFKEMKRLADWQYVLGVNLLNQHLSMTTLTGARKYDYPPSFSYHAPWWPHYKSLNQYFTRLSLALSTGTQQNKILVIAPTTSAWMYVSRSRKLDRFNEIGNVFQAFVTRLEKAQVEYDLGSENVIKDYGNISGGQFIVGKTAYTTVVIPPGMENIDAATFSLLRDYVAQGGKVVQFEALDFLDGRHTDEVKNQLANQKNVWQFPGLNEQLIAEHFSSKDFKISRSAGDSIGNLYHHRRQLNDGQLIFLANASMTGPATGSLEVSGRDAILMDAFTGELSNYPEEVKKDNILVRFNLPAAGSLLLFVSHQKRSGYSAQRSLKKGSVMKTDVSKVIRPAENTLMIDFCDLKLKDSLISDLHVSTASKLAFTRNGFNRNPWDHQMQFRKRFIERDTFKIGSGFTASYHFNIEKNTGFKKLRAVVEQGYLWNSIRINGVKIEPAKGKWWLDRSFSVLEIGSYLHPGDNTIALSVDPMRIYAEIESIYILGDFNLQSANKGWRIVAPGPLNFGAWNLQGLPMYGHDITYQKNLKLTDINANYVVQLGEWAGTVAVVRVNGKEAGIITSEPDNLNITKHLKPGDNIVEVKVIGSLKNLLGPHHNSPEPGMVGPDHWRVKSYPPGDHYETLPYGLMEDFKVIKYPKSL